MALTTSSGYNSNSIPGHMSVGGDVDIYEINTTQKYAIGTQVTRQDGNRYRYASFVQAVTQGKLVSHVVADVDNASTNALLIAPVATYQQVTEQVGTYPGSINSRYLVMTLASVIKDQFAGGYITITKDTGLGYIYRIKGNTATGVGTPTATVILIELYDKLQVATDLTSDCSIVGALYTDLLINSVGTDFVSVGVTCANMTAGTFGWICTKGVCSVLQSDTMVGGDVVQASSTVSGAVMALGVGSTSVSQVILAGGQSIVGYCIMTSANAQYCTIYLQLD